MRAVGRCGILRGVEGAHMAGGNACQTMDGLGEVVPGDDTLVGEVVDARNNTLFDSSEDSHCQIACIGGRTYLIEDDAQFGFLLTQANHCLDEVIAKGGIEPGCADDH